MRPESQCASSRRTLYPLGDSRCFVEFFGFDFIDVDPGFEPRLCTLRSPFVITQTSLFFTLAKSSTRSFSMSRRDERAGGLLEMITTIEKYFSDFFCELNFLWLALEASLMERKFSFFQFLLFSLNNFFNLFLDSRVSSIFFLFSLTPRNNNFASRIFHRIFRR